MSDAICLTILLFACGLWVRNFQVYRFDRRLIEDLDKVCRADIQAGVDFMPRWRAYESVTYIEKLLKFWRPLTVEAFYAKNFLHAAASPQEREP